MQTVYRENRDGSLDILLYVSEEELGMDFASLCRFFAVPFQKCRRTAMVRKVNIILAGTVALSIPFSYFVRVGADSRYAMSYVYFGTEEAQLSSVSKAVKTLSVVSPSYFNLTSDGRLSLENISQSFVEKMHAAGVRVVPFLSNHWDRGSGEAALRNREALADAISQAVRDYHLDGVNVDIENLTEAQRESYTDFVRLLRARLPKEKEVSVAVSANPWGSQTGWQGSYDYAALGKICDHLLIMAYDEHYQGGEEGAVAGLPFVEKSIRYALTVVPSEKLVLGIPFYGRIWGESLSGHGVSLETVATLEKRYKAEKWYDTAARSPVLRITIPIGETGPSVGGKPLRAGSYIIYYENADSIKEKLALVGKYDLKGAGNWSAGQETDDVWNYYTLWLNGQYFSDIANHFAKDEIVKITKDGIMQGQGEAEFAPEVHLSRAEAAVICTRLLNLRAGGAQFTDVPPSHWARAAIQSVAAEGIMTGYPDGSFHPEEGVSRAEMATILSRIIEENASGDMQFSDVDNTHWAKEEILALARLGVLEGYPDGSFQPENKINRGETAVILERVQDFLR